MNTWDLILGLLIAIAFCAALYFSVKRRGGCGCSGCASAAGCSAAASSCSCGTRVKARAKARAQAEKESAGAAALNGQPIRCQKCGCTQKKE